MLYSDQEDVMIFGGPENLEFEDYDSHDDEIINKVSKQIYSLERPPILLFWGGMTGAVITGIIFGPVTGVLCLGVGLTSLGINACINDSPRCGLPCIPNKND